LRTQAEFFAPLAAQRGIALLLSEPLPDAVVHGDASWLERMFSNLLDNAIKYSREGDRVEVTLRLEADGARVTIADSGPGISTEDLPQLFERFARGAGGGGRSGFGLGLPLAREIARAHGGSLEVASELGHGSRFSVLLPLSSEAGEATPEHARAPRSRKLRASRGRLYESALRRR
jgi:signal transduction histidine kinase